MINKPKISRILSASYLTSIFAILLTLANPTAASAKSVSFSQNSIFSSIINTNTLKNTTIFASTTYEDQKIDEETDSFEDLDKAQRLDTYFTERSMPLAGHGIEFVRAANKYGLDWRLIAAIGVRESSGGKHLMNNNPFGWGSAKIKFDDFSEAIDVVSSNLGGFNPNTARYYKNADTMKKLWYYNGTVIKSYPNEVVDIMNMF